MPSVVKHSFVRLRGGKNYGRLFAHINYVQWRPDDERAKDDRVTPNYYNEARFQEQERQFVEQGGDKEKASLREAVDELTEGKEARDPDKPWARLFYTEDRDRVTGTELKMNIRTDLERGDVVHKLMMSPGDNRVDLPKYCRDVMQQLSQVKGQDLRYAFVIHENTDHHHAHMLVLGRDKEGCDVRLTRDDHIRLRAFGDRILEREYGIEQHFDRQMEEWCRDNGVNIMFDKDREHDFWKLVDMPDDEFKQRYRNPISDMLEWDKFNDDWRKFIEDMQGREGGKYFGQNEYEEVGRFSDLRQLWNNKREIAEWEEIAKNEPDKKELADSRLEELRQADREFRESLGEKTKPFDEQRFLDRLAAEMREESAQFFAPVDKAVEESKDKGKAIDELTGMDGQGKERLDDLVQDFDNSKEKDPIDDLIGTADQKRGDDELDLGANLQPASDDTSAASNDDEQELDHSIFDDESYDTEGENDAANQGPERDDDDGFSTPSSMGGLG